MLKPRTRLRRHNTKSFRVLKEFDNHEMVIGITDTSTKLRGYIAIHNTNLGPALGGTRLQHYNSEEAALRDVLNLSKAMSYKCAIAGLPWGGGKAVIFADKEAERESLLESYAKSVESLGGLFKTGTDVGIMDGDVKKMAAHTKHMLGVGAADRADLTTSKMAALGVYYCIKASLARAFKNDSLKNRTVGVKGLGKLGGELARLLYEDGAHLKVADIDVAKTEKFVKNFPGTQVVPVTEIHRQKLDIYAPCALGGEFSSRIIDELKTKIIAGGANNQLTDDRVGDRLFQTGILYAPDYVTNAGGLIYVADELEADGFHKDRVLRRVAGIQDTLEQIFSTSQKKKIATHRVANQLGFKRITEGKV